VVFAAFLFFILEYEVVSTSMFKNYPSGQNILLGPFNKILLNKC